MDGSKLTNCFSCQGNCEGPKTFTDSCCGLCAALWDKCKAISCISCIDKNYVTAGMGR